MGFNAPGAQDWTKLQGLAFMMMATVIRGACQPRLKGSGLKEMYMPEVLLRPSQVTLVRHSDKWFIENKNQKTREPFEALNAAPGTGSALKSAFSCT